jgi:hypothetical protein
VYFHLLAPGSVHKQLVDGAHAQVHACGRTGYAVGRRRVSEAQTPASCKRGTDARRGFMRTQFGKEEDGHEEGGDDGDHTAGDRAMEKLGGLVALLWESVKLLEPVAAAAAAAAGFSFHPVRHRATRDPAGTI